MFYIILGIGSYIVGCVLSCKLGMIYGETSGNLKGYEEGLNDGLRIWDDVSKKYGEVDEIDWEES